MKTSDNEQYARPADLILSFGDLIRQSGYRTRVLGELLHIERDSSMAPVVLAFDTQAGLAEPEGFEDVPVRIRQRRAQLYYSEIRRVSRERRIQVVHAHNLYSAALALSTRGFFDYKVILDLHGRIPEEYVFLGKGGNVSRIVLNALERWIVTRADHVVVVSEALRCYLRETYSIDDSRLSVIPCCADESRFRWDPDQRRSERDRLNLADRFVCVHLGSIREWYRPEAVVEAFQGMRQKVPSAHLLIVTPDVDQASTYIERYLPREVFTVTASKHSGVPALLNASDLGMLLLPDTPNIRTSSPTKFAEYLNCGLPVLISPHVGDFTSLVATSGAGYVTDPGHPIDPEFLTGVVSSRDLHARRCVRTGAAFRWSRYRDAWDTILARLERD